MSPIGRIFIIVNLVLAAAFIGFAGTFLQNHTNYKQQFEEEVSARADEKAQLESANETLRVENSTLKNQVTTISNNFDNEKTTNAALESDKARLSAQLDTMEGGINMISANTAAAEQTLSDAVTEMVQSFKDGLTAQQERDQAVLARETAVADLRAAQFEITQRQDQIDNLSVQVTDMQKTVREQEILIAAARQQGFNIAVVQPDLRGVVSVVGAGGRLVTVSVTENPGEAEIAPGVSFAIHSDGTYKAEAVVTSVEGTFAFCRVTPNPQGAPPIAVGDRATTRTDVN